MEIYTNLNIYLLPAAKVNHFECFCWLLYTELSWNKGGNTKMKNYGNMKFYRNVEKHLLNDRNCRNKKN